MFIIVNNIKFTFNFLVWLNRNNNNNNKNNNSTNNKNNNNKNYYDNYKQELTITLLHIIIDKYTNNNHQ